MQVREFRSGVEKRNVELENELEQVKLQLQERNIQVIIFLIVSFGRDQLMLWKVRWTLRINFKS